MEAQVPRHLNKKPLIAGLEPIELLLVAALLIGSNICCKTFELSGLWPAILTITTFSFLKFYKRGKAPGHFLYLARFHLGQKSLGGFLNAKQD
jgi:hypothetical protein